MTLVPFARRLAANKARDKAAGAAGSASSDGTAPPPDDPAPAAGELEAAVAEAQAMLAEAGETPEALVGFRGGGEFVTPPGRR